MAGGYIEKQTIDAVINTCDIASVVGEYVKLNRRGTEWWGCCPFHHEKSPSFHVIPDKGYYHCFGCHAGGNVIKFVQEMEKITYPEAIVFLAKKSGIEVRYTDSSYAQIPKVDNTKELYIDLYNRVASMFHYLLTQTSGGKFAYEYIKNRGLTDETIEKFKLGYSPADRRWLKGFLKSKNFSDEFLAKSGLFSKNYPDVAFFSDRLMFPIFDRRGQTVALGGRLLRGEGPKYLNSGDLIQYQKGETLYAFNLAKNSIRQEKKVIFCEGYMDCIAYHQCGITYAVAPLGTALTDEQIKIVRGFVDYILLSFDSDGAGQKATRRAILMCRKQGVTCKVIRLHGGKDPAEIMVNYGVETLTNDVNNAILDSDYLLDSLSHEFEVNTPEGKTKAALAFFPYIDALQNTIQKESCLEQLGQRFNISPEAVRRDFNNREQARGRAESVQHPIENVNIKLDAEIRVLMAVLSDTNQFELMYRELDESDFENNLARQIYSVIKKCYLDGDLSFSSVLMQCGDNRVQELITSSVASGEFAQNTAVIIADGIANIKRNSLEKRRRQILEQIRVLSPSTPEDQSVLNQLLAEMGQIDNKLK